ncbi:hypothetical protein EVAR_7488_1 [Eumeta japonica]|uniref:Uncharacterized protein n=1 Tax=Eumeta variegata TaxID=151549 RepID=A0A4C1Y1W7_EUMVA|nr:hypothetical protein EVAR_7488_1 [Eumeta japonica]
MCIITDIASPRRDVLPNDDTKHDSRHLFERDLVVPKNERRLGGGGGRPPRPAPLPAPRCRAAVGGYTDGPELFLVWVFRSTKGIHCPISSDTEFESSTLARRLVVKDRCHQCGDDVWK